MMYRGYPALSAAEKRAALPPLVLDRVARAPAELPLAMAPDRVRLENLGAEPVYRALVSGRWQAFSALDGRPVPADEATARRAVAAFTGGPTGRLVAQLERADQWTLSASLAPHFPLRRFALDDEVGTVLYVSRAAEVVHVSTRAQRFWAWLGAIPHWIYPTMLRRERELWSVVVISLASVGLVVAASGMVVGLLRLRGRAARAAGKAASPHHGLLAWHHYAGLGFGTVLFTWMLSGLFSMNPGNWSSGSSPEPEQVLAVAGGALDLGRFRVPPRPIPGAAAPVELELGGFAGKPFYLHRTSAACLRQAADAPARVALPAFSPAELRAAVERAWPGVAIARFERLDHYDLYYYDHRRQEAPLPIWRAELADPVATWVHLDPVTGRVVARLERTGRLERWLYNGLHSWDFGAFYAARPAWDLTLLPLLVGGSLLSGTGLWAAFRWLLRVRTRHSFRARPGFSLLTPHRRPRP